MTSLSMPLLPSSIQNILSIVTALLLGFALPTSTLLTNIALGLVLVCVIWRSNIQAARALIVNPLVWIPIAIWTLFAIVFCFTPNDEGLSIISKYKKLLYILPLALFFLLNTSLIRRFIQGFLSANLLVLAISLLYWFGIATPNGEPMQNATVFKNHIVQNVLMAFAALIWLSLAWKNSGRYRWGYTLLALIAGANILMMVYGRSGYVALFVGISVWLFLILPKKWRLLAAASTGCLIIMLVLTPNPAKQRVILGVQEIQRCLDNRKDNAYQACHSSMGQRTEFIFVALDQIKKSPWFGSGAGTFEYHNPQNGYHINNPHNEYLMQTINGGLIGLALFFIWTGYCFRAANRLPFALRALSLGLLSSYMACHLFNSFLLDFAEGLFFIILVSFFVQSQTKTSST